MRTRDANKEIVIKQKAIEMIVSQGFDGLSMHKLAKASGVSVATIYIYFKDRESLLQQLYKEESIKLADATLINFDPESHFDEGLKVQWLNRMNYCMENQISMTFMEQFKHSPMVDRSVMERRFIDAMSKFVHTAIAREELIPLPVEIYWSIAFGPLYQLVKFHISKTSMPGRPPFVFDDEKINLTLSLVIKALKP
ncbi:TetR/AcrR family transcriptional regulator [Dyadobacter frigoris]|uniref:TetR/AcrR family transcriptional regulator n=1 Tax=Dyadobacter frigoris TaxID=2576211 RepID=A0A4U6CS67_9BACT|nr:TetR/AcrR family transcriptional regulator [Dyadobacter frigoris]TKT87422.1 TetR/AcrR family transcriptional regulator [Dyadobacter frigoris]GLU52329.1 TetR family transcriptional regulator [Dyadobacter frigoris]